MVIINENLKDHRLNTPSAVVAHSECVFDHIIINLLSDFNQNTTSQNVVVLLSTNKDPKKGTNFSLTGNLARFNKNREAMSLDDSNPVGVITTIHDSVESLLDEYDKQFHC